MELSRSLEATHRVPQEIFPRKPYNKSLIDQACSVKMDIALVLFLHVYGPRLRLGP